MAAEDPSPGGRPVFPFQGGLINKTDKIYKEKFIKSVFS